MMARRSSPDSSLFLDRRKERHGGILHRFHRIRWNYFWGPFGRKSPMMPTVSCARLTSKRIVAICNGPWAVTNGFGSRKTSADYRDGGPQRITNRTSKAAFHLLPAIPFLPVPDEIGREFPVHGLQIMPPSELCRIESRGQPRFLLIAGCRSLSMLQKVGIILRRLAFSSDLSSGCLTTLSLRQTLVLACDRF